MMRGIEIFGSGILLWVGLIGSLSAQTEAGLVAYWPLDSANGTTPDEIAAFDLTLNGMGSADLAEGHIGQAFQFNGEDQFLSIEHEAGGPLPIYSQGSYSVTLWVNGPAGQADNRVFSEASSTSDNPLFNIGTDFEGESGVVDIYIRPGPGHQRSSGVAFDDTWHHIAWVDDGGDARLYIDGELDETDFSYDREEVDVDITSLGAILRGSGPVTFYEGMIDDVALWETALTPQQIEALAAGTSPPEIEAAAPAIVEPPQGATIVEGERLTLSVAVTGPGPFNYQWFRDGEALPEADQRDLVLEEIATSDAGEYTVEVSNDQGSVTSEPAVVEVEVLNETDAGLLTYWPLNETEDGMTPDAVNDFDLTLHEMDETARVEGRVDGAFELDGEGQFLSVTPEIQGGIPIYNHGDGTYSISLWVRGAAQPDNRVFSEGSSQDNTPLLNIGTDNTGESGVVDLFVRNDTPAGGRSVVPLNHRHSTSVAFDEEWHHIAWVDDNGEARLYIDGELDATDFNYNRGRLTLDTVAVGAIMRAEPCCFFEGSLDEVALWNQALTSEQVQALAAGTAATEIEPAAPEVVEVPDRLELLTRGDLRLSASVAGTGPLTFQWLKDGEEIPGATTRELLIPTVGLEDAGAYRVQVENSEGTSLSDPMEVVIEERPAPPTELSIDINERDIPEEEQTQEGFESFMLEGEDVELGEGETEAGSEGGIISVPMTKDFDGVEFTLAPTGDFGLDDRRRETPQNSGEFTQEELLRDFVFAVTEEDGEGLDARFRFLKPNQHYEVTVWAFDTGSTGERVSDWWANGDLVMPGYTFDGSVLPETDRDYRTSFEVVTDSQGTLLIEGRRSGGGSFGVFLDAIRVREIAPPIEITHFTREGGMMTLEIQTRFPHREHRIHEAIDPAAGGLEWREVDAEINETGDGDLLGELAQPEADQALYRVVALAPEPLLSSDFETGAEGWTQGGPNGNWEVGSPTTGPEEAHSGENVWATGLDEPYPLEADAWLRSPEIDLTGLEQATLSFWEWRHTEPALGGSFFHHVELNIKDAEDPDGEPLTQLFQEGGPAREWQQRTFILGEPIVGGSIVIEFLLHSDPVIEDPLPGWFIDDVSVVPE